jgi:hypothetical protein
VQRLGPPSGGLWRSGCVLPGLGLIGRARSSRTVAFGDDVANAQFLLPSTGLRRYRRTMDEQRHRDWQRQFLESLGALFCERYGRDGNVIEVGRPVTLLEAGYATAGGWWVLQSALDEMTTSFQTEHFNARLDLLFRDLLTHPEDRADEQWARRYGYSSVSAASRAFRQRFRLELRDVRKMGYLSLWLAERRNEPHRDAGRLREEEAELRLRTFRRALQSRPLGPHARRAVRALGKRRAEAHTIVRPRYPAVGVVEAKRLHMGAKR